MDILDEMVPVFRSDGHCEELMISKTNVSRRQGAPSMSSAAQSDQVTVVERVET